MRHICAALLMLSIPAEAGDAIPRIVELSPGADLRAAPPSGGALGFPGAVTSTTQRGQPYVVIREFSVQQGFGVTRWSQVAPVGPTGTINTRASGWVLVDAKGGLKADPVKVTDVTISGAATDRVASQLRQLVGN